MNRNSFKINRTTAEIAQLVGGRLEGDPSLIIKGLGTLDDAGPEDISFLGNPKYLRAAADSKAACLLLPSKGPYPSRLAPCRIYVEDPQYAFAKILLEIESRIPQSPALIDERAIIHPEARIDPHVSVGAFSMVERGASIGEYSTIFPQCYVGSHANIGRHCRIYPHVVIRENCVIGDGTIIHPGAVIGADGFGFSTDKKTGRHRKIPQIGNVVIEEDVEIGANTTIDRATIGSTIIGAGTKIDNLVQIAHNTRVGRNCIIVSQVGISGSVRIGDRVILAGQAGVAGHLKIGEDAIIMAQSGIMGDVEKGSVLFGSPARPRREALRLQALYSRLPELFSQRRERSQLPS